MIRPGQKTWQERLSNRELQVITAIELGSSYKTIGEALGISFYTVRLYARFAREKGWPDPRYGAGPETVLDSYLGGAL